MTSGAWFGDRWYGRDWFAEDWYGGGPLVEMVPVCVKGEMNTRLNVEHTTASRLQVAGDLLPRLEVELGRLTCR